MAKLPKFMRLPKLLISPPKPDILFTNCARFKLFKFPALSNPEESALNGLLKVWARFAMLLFRLTFSLVLLLLPLLLLLFMKRFGLGVSDGVACC